MKATALAASLPVRGAMPTGQELQHMLSKKVAQLTKVIFHLNTRNEDQETRLQNMQAAYEAEIDSIVADAAGKLSESKAALDKASSAGREAFEKRVSVIAAKFEAEKQSALAEFKEARTKMQAAAEARIDAATQQLDEIRKGFARRLAELDTLLAEAGVARDKAASELKQVLQVQNARYSSMLAEQLGEQDALRQRLGAAARQDQGQGRRFRHRADSRKRDPPKCALLRGLL